MRENVNRKVVWSSVSEKDLVGIGISLEEGESRIVAAKVLNDIEDAGERLEYQTLLFRKRDNIYLKARFVLVHSYVIVYVVEGMIVAILRVIHGARDIEAIFHTDDNPRL